MVPYLDKLTILSAYSVNSELDPTEFSTKGH